MRNVLNKASLAILLAVAVATPPLALGAVGIGPLNFRATPLSPGDQASAVAELPSWTVGTTWTYAIKGRAQAPLEHTVFQGNLTATVAATVSAADSGIGAEVYRVDFQAVLKGRADGRLDGPAQAFTFKDGMLTGSQWYRTDSLALAKETMALSLKATNGATNLTLQTSVTDTYTPALMVYAFPLKVGEAWNRTSMVRTVGSATINLQGPQGTINAPVTWDLNYTLMGSSMVVSYDNATTPLGTFKAFHIVANSGKRGLGEERENETNEERENETMEVRDDIEQDGVQGIAPTSVPMPMDGKLLGHLRFQPASQIWYSAQVGNAVGFKLHLPMGMAKVMVVGDLVAYHLA